MVAPRTKIKINRAPGRRNQPRQNSPAAPMKPQPFSPSRRRTTNRTYQGLAGFLGATMTLPAPHQQPNITPPSATYGPRSPTLPPPHASCQQTTSWRGFVPLVLLMVRRPRDTTSIRAGEGQWGRLPRVEASKGMGGNHHHNICRRRAKSNDCRCDCICLRTSQSSGA